MPELKDKKINFESLPIEEIDKIPYTDKAREAKRLANLDDKKSKRQEAKYEMQIDLVIFDSMLNY
jgi:hypothetical protein